MEALHRWLYPSAVPAFERELETAAALGIARARLRVKPWDMHLEAAAGQAKEKFTQAHRGYDRCCFEDELKHPALLKGEFTRKVSEDGTDGAGATDENLALLDTFWRTVRDAGEWFSEADVNAGASDGSDGDGAAARLFPGQPRRKRVRKIA